MEITFKNYAFDISIINGEPTLNRRYEFNNGETISFAITLPRDDSATIPVLHVRSVEAAIKHLKSLIEQQ
jgi:hypothetical protein